MGRGRRRFAVLSLAGSLIGAALVSLAPAGSAIAASTASLAGAATAYQINPGHDGAQTDASFGTSLKKAWSHQLGGEVFYPLIVGNRVYVDATHAAGNGTAVYAFDATTGARVWGPIDIGGLYPFGAITYDGGRIFALNSQGMLFGFDAATGARRWVTQLPGQYMFTSPPTALNGVVYAGGAGSGGTLYAVDEKSGAVKWTAPVMNGDHSSPAVTKGGVYVSYACEQTYGFALTGRLMWHHSTGCEGGGGRTPVVHKGSVYVRDMVFGPVVLDASAGRLLGAFTSSTTPAVSGTMMATLDASGVLHGVKLASGTIRWSNASQPYVTAPLIVNGLVVEGAANGTVSLLDLATGRTRWTGTAGSVIYHPDEHNATGIVGLAEAHGVLAVPTGTSLTVFRVAKHSAGS